MCPDHNDDGHDDDVVDDHDDDDGHNDDDVDDHDDDDELFGEQDDF